jgi:hypothetical protein
MKGECGNMREGAPASRTPTEAQPSCWSSLRSLTVPLPHMPAPKACLRPHRVRLVTEWQLGSNKSPEPASPGSGIC